MRTINKIVSYLTSLVVSITSIINIIICYRQSEKKKMLVFSNALNHGGAPLVLWQALKVFRERDYSIYVVSLRSGELQNENANDINMFVIKHFQGLLRFFVCRMPWDKVLINTVVMSKWVNKFDKTDTIWWIHEGKSYIDQFKSIMPKKLNSNVRVFCVSDWSAFCLKSCGFNYETKILYYSIPDTKREANNLYQEKDYTTFLMVGALCKRKCQLDFIAAINVMSLELKKRCRFVIIGDVIKGEEKYAECVKKQIQTMGENIKHIYRVPHDKMDDIYKEADVVVCCSNDDPLPVVVTEAFMNCKCVILGTNCGQNKIVTPYTNALVFESGNVQALVTALEYASINRKKLFDIGIESRKLYNEYFSMTKFKEELIGLLQGNS